jgi:UDP-2-acetamido-3-amino-2,3-dideoxy-glucuronate N-acetyltransferase
VVEIPAQPLTGRRKDPPFIHPAAIVETKDIGSGTRVWAFTHVLCGARIGADCNIGGHCYVESSVTIGDAVTVKNGVSVWDGVTLEDGVFVGPAVVFTNDRRPRSARNPEVAHRYASDEWLERTVVCRGATVGAGAIILPGLTIGEFAFVAAGSLVTRDVPAYELVRGVPARPAAWVCRCGAELEFVRGEGECADCGMEFQRIGEAVAPLAGDGSRLEANRRASRSTLSGKP